MITVDDQVQFLLVGAGLLLVVFAILGVVIWPHLKEYSLSNELRTGLGLLGLTAFLIGISAETTGEIPAPSPTRSTATASTTPPTTTDIEMTTTSETTSPPTTRATTTTLPAGQPVSREGESRDHPRSSETGRYGPG